MTSTTGRGALERRLTDWFFEGSSEPVGPQAKHATDWWKVIVNPSWPYRLPHMLMAAWITGSFAVAGIGAWYLLKGKHEAFGRRTVSMGTSFAVVLSVVR